MVNHYTLADGAILLAPDVREYFSDSEAVNEALRSLIHLMSLGREQRMTLKVLWACLSCRGWARGGRC